MSRRRVAGLIALGALALTASYPPFALPVLPFFAVTPAVLLIRQGVTDADPRRAFRWGFWYGVVAQGGVLYWLVVALWHFTKLAALGYLATIVILGLWTGVLFWRATSAFLGSASGRPLPTLPSSSSGRMSPGLTVSRGGSCGATC